MREWGAARGGGILLQVKAGWWPGAAHTRARRGDLVRLGRPVATEEEEKGIRRNPPGKLVVSTDRSLADVYKLQFGPFWYWIRITAE